MALVLATSHVQTFLPHRSPTTDVFSADGFRIPDLSLLRQRQHEGYGNFSRETNPNANTKSKSADQQSHRLQFPNKRTCLKRSDKGNGDSEDESDVENGRPLQRPYHGHYPNFSFACPFDKSTTLLHYCGCGCTEHNIPSISDLSQHLTRRHVRSNFVTHGSWRPRLNDGGKHVGEIECHSCRNRTMTRSQQRQIHMIVHNRTRALSERIFRWYQIFEVLFPSCDLPHSPFIIPYEDLPLKTRGAVQRAKAGVYTKRTLPRSICIISENAYNPLGFDAHNSDTASTSTSAAQYNGHVHGEAYDTNRRLPRDTPPQAVISHVVQRLLHSWALHEMRLRLDANFTNEYGTSTDKTSITQQPQRQQRKPSPGCDVEAKNERQRRSGKDTGRGHKRKRAIESDGEDGDDESDPLQDPGPAPQDHGHGASLMCPFHWHDPVVFSEHNKLETEYHSCGIVMLDNIARLKQHLRRVHQMPAFFCDRCFKTFKDKPSHTQHNRQADRCPVIEPERFRRKMTDGQVEIIKKRLMGRTDSEKWKFIYRTLFPHGDLPNSAYHDGISPFLTRRLPGALTKAFAKHGINVSNEDFNSCCVTVMESLRKELNTPHEDQDELVATGCCNLTDALQSMPLDSMTTSETTLDTLSILSPEHDEFIEEIGQAEMMLDWDKFWPADEEDPAYNVDTYTEHEFTSVF